MPKKPVKVLNRRLFLANQLKRIHSSSARTARLGLEPNSTSLFVCAAILITLAISANVYVRHAQFQIWQAAGHTDLTSDSPTFSTADAPYFLAHAVTYKRDEAITLFESKRSYPNNMQVDTETEEISGVRDRPLLSILIAIFAKNDDPTSLLKAANQGLLATSALTAFAIIFCFGAAGCWIQGAIASLGGGLSAAYLVRSSIGRIDTDQLNLGFMYLIFGLVVFAGRSTSPQRCLGWCMLAGAAANLFMWWYGKPELIFIAAVALFWLLTCLQRQIFTILLGTIAFIVISGIASFNLFESVYLKDVLENSQFTFPNTLKTITETQSVSFARILVNATGSVEMGIFSLTGLALFLIRNPVIAIAYGPLVAFGLLNFIVGNRAIFYSAPIMWFGAAYLMTSTARFVAENISRTGDRSRRINFATVLASSLAVVVAWVNSPTDYVPRPSFPKPVLEGLASLELTTNPVNSVVATWWDYGYVSMFLNHLPTFHDGGSQLTPSTHFVAHALLDDEQVRSISTLKFLSTKGHKGIAAEHKFSSLRTQFYGALNDPSPDLYLVFTSQMASWMGSISRLGNWDIERGEPIELRGNPNGPLVNYEPLNCRMAGYPQTLSCAGTAFDLERGLINGAPLLVGWAHSQNGTTIRGKNFGHDGDLAVQIIQTGNRVNVFLMHRQLFESSFNELFYLGQIDHPSVSLHYDNYPHIRIYKIDGEPKG